MKEVIIQLLGILAWLFLLNSYRARNIKKIIVIQLISSSLYIAHYYFLGAYSGVFTCSVSLLTGFLFYFSKNRKFSYLFIIPILSAGAYFFYNGPLSLAPVLANLIDSYALTKYKKTVLKFSIVSYSLWIIYDIFVKSYSCILTDSLVLLSNLGIIISNNKTNLLRVDKERPLMAREELFK